ncbi:NADPH-dependent FMN reductase [Poriferisphaera sp. WC338]|uniref:NADPH-dependent FMN reductase n=1 Tax=Poriferisphaera sp. WC338 TaxID=3425129 RepID=UPI003D818ECD
MRVLIIRCSLNPDSRSARLATHAAELLTAEHGADVETVNLREYELPLCDGGEAYMHPNVAKMKSHIDAADAVLLAVPVYNYYANAAAKNLIELTGRVWTDKVVGFLAAAGGHGSYMSLMSLANSLMLDFHCLIVPRFVYTTDQGFHEAGHPQPNVELRIRELCHDLAHLGRTWQENNRPDRPENSSSSLS